MRQCGIFKLHQRSLSPIDVKRSSRRSYGKRCRGFLGQCPCSQVLPRSRRHPPFLQKHRPRCWAMQAFVSRMVLRFIMSQPRIVGRLVHSGLYSYHDRAFKNTIYDVRIFDRRHDTSLIMSTSRARLWDRLLARARNVPEIRLGKTRFVMRAYLPS